VRAKDEYALWFVLGKQSRAEIAQEVSEGALKAATLDHYVHEGILDGDRFGEGEEG